MQSQFWFATRIIDKLCAQHKAFFMLVNLALIWVASVREVKPFSAMMTNEVSLRTKRCLMRNSKLLACCASQLTIETWATVNYGLLSIACFDSWEKEFCHFERGTIEKYSDIAGDVLNIVFSHAPMSVPMVTNEVPLGTKRCQSTFNEEQQTTACWVEQVSNWDMRNSKLRLA